MMSNAPKCCICDENVSRYKCPACSSQTCSLPCVKEHKSRENCSGIRNRVAMIQKDEMDNLTLSSDYRFLQEVEEKLEEGLKNPVKRNEEFNALPQHLKRLKLEAKDRGTNLEYMPRNFSKHRDNATRFNFREKKIRWQLKWVFPHAEVTYIEEKIDEDTLVIDALRKFMEPLCRLDDVDKEEKIDEDTSRKLEYYQSASYNRISVLLKLEMTSIGNSFDEMSLSRSFRHNFFNKKIIEYPCLYVVFKDQISAFMPCYPGSSSALPRNEVTSSKELCFFGHMSPTDDSSDSEVDQH